MEQSTKLSPELINMKTQPTGCPSHEALTALVAAGRFDPSDGEGEMPRHLGGCKKCQQALQDIAADQQSWQEAAEALSSAEAVPTENLGALLATLKTLPGKTKKTRPKAAPTPVDLSFLDPPTVAGDVGRLKQYRIVELVGQGGFGLVFKAIDEPLRRVVAIKVMAPMLAVSEAARARFHREAQAAAAVTQENVVTIYAVDDHRGLPYLAMEFIGGMSLQDWLDREGALSVEETLRIGMQAAEGLAAAHKQGLVHRDVKPGNILLQNSVQRVKITDFDLARAVDDASLTQSGTIAGTPQYMAPEQASGQRRVDSRADLFSLGSVLFAMCTGRVPFRADTVHGVLHQVIEKSAPSIQSVVADLPAWLDEIIARLHAKDPAERFQTADEVAELLRAHLAHLQDPGRCPQPGRLRSSGWRGRHYAVAAGILAVTCLAGVLLAVLCWPRQPEVNPNDPPGATAPAQKTAVPAAITKEQPESKKGKEPEDFLPPPFKGKGPEQGDWPPDKKGKDKFFKGKGGFGPDGKGPPDGKGGFGPDKGGFGPDKGGFGPDGKGKGGPFGDGDMLPPPKGPKGQLRLLSK